MRKLALLGALFLGAAQPAQAASLLYGLGFTQTSTQSAPQYRGMVSFPVPTGFFRFNTDTNRVEEFRVNNGFASSLFDFSAGFNALLAQQPACDFACLVSAINGSAWSFDLTTGNLSLGLGGPFNSAVVLDVDASNLLAVTREQGTYRVSGPIPEPSTWAMLILGFGVIGATLRRRRSVVATA